MILTKIEALALYNTACATALQVYKDNLHAITLSDRGVRAQASAQNKLNRVIITKIKRQLVIIGALPPHDATLPSNQLRKIELESQLKALL